MNPLRRSAGARFAPDVEADYQAQLGPEKLRVARLAAWVAVLLFSGFATMDFWAIPSAMYQVWVVRAAADLLALAMIAATLWRPRFLLAHYTPLVSSYYGLLAAAVGAMIALASPDELAWSSYHGGLLLVSTAIYSFTYLSPRAAGLTGAFVLALYVAVGLGIQGMASTGHLPDLVANCFFLVGTNIIGLVAVNIRERFSRQAYLLKNALQRDVELKDEERRRSLHLAEHDPLTGLPNRVRFMRRLDETIESAAASRHSVAVLFIDLDGFKQVNDTCGHRGGDVLLQVLARRIRACLRPSDLVARLGGDEFVVALQLPDEPAEAIQRLGQKIVDAVCAPVKVEERMLAVTASVGAAFFPMHGRDAVSLLAAADAQMYDVKRAGKGAVGMAREAAAQAV